MPRPADDHRARDAAPKAQRAIAKRDAALDVAPTALADDICRMVEAARQQVATTVNAELPLLHWRIGARIRTEVLGALAQRLTHAYGRGFSEKSLRRMVQFAEGSPTNELSRQRRDN